MREKEEKQKMGEAWRSIIKIFLTILLVVSLISFIVSISLYQFTSYDNLKPRVTAFVEQQFSQEVSQLSPEEITSIQNTITKNCSSSNEISLPLEDQTSILSDVKLDCSKINNQTTIEQYAGLVSESIFDSIYYKTYSCNILDCLKDTNQDPQNLPAIVSKKANSTFLTFTILFLIISLILILGLILLSKPKYTCFYNFAPAFLIPGLFFIAKSPINSAIISVQEPINSFLKSLSNILFTNFLIFLILGAVFLILGIVFKAVNSKKKAKK